MSVRRSPTVLALTCAGLVWLAPIPASAAPSGPTPGYWLVGADGGVFSFRSRLAVERAPRTLGTR
jgi:hypothetical protein